MLKCRGAIGRLRSQDGRLATRVASYSHVEPVRPCCHLREAQMANAPELVFDLIFGRWRSQTLYAGAALGVFDQLSDQPSTAASVAEAINVNPAMLYRLMRALGSIGLLVENDEKAFRLTDAGALLREDHPHSLR